LALLAVEGPKEMRWYKSSRGITVYIYPYQLCIFTIFHVYCSGRIGTAGTAGHVIMLVDMIYLSV